MALKDRHQKFVNEYIANGYNATSAYLSAYSDKETKDANGQIVKSSVTVNSARVMGSLLLKNADIQSEITRQKAQLSAKYDIKLEYIVNELLELIKSCKENGLDGQGTITDRNNWNKAITQLATLMGFNVRKVEHSGEIKQTYTLQIPGMDFTDNSLKIENIKELPFKQLPFKQLPESDDDSLSDDEDSI